MTARGARGFKKKKRKPARKGVFPGKPPGGLRGDRALHNASRPEASRMRCRGPRAAADAESHSRASVSPADQHRLGRTPIPAAWDSRDPGRGPEGDVVGGQVARATCRRLGRDPAPGGAVAQEPFKLRARARDCSRERAPGAQASPAPRRANRPLLFPDAGVARGDASLALAPALPPPSRERERVPGPHLYIHERWGGGGRGGAVGGAAAAGPRVPGRTAGGGAIVRWR